MSTQTHTLSPSPSAPTQPTLKQLVRDKRVQFSFVRGARTPLAKQDDWQRKANGYTCTLRFEGRRYTFDFWQGTGCTDAPDASGTLSCLLSDAEAGNGTFEDFCGDFGYDTDSRKAEATHRACARTAVALHHLLRTDYETFLYAERD